MEYRQPDRMPRYWQDFWPELTENWTQAHRKTNLFEHFGSDMFLVGAIETAWPSQAGLVEQQGDQVLIRTG
jgi:hypothetical protein